MQGETTYDGPQHDQLVIGKASVTPGNEEIVRLDVGRLPSGTRIHMNLFVYRSAQPGPVLLAMAGLHGDEINGIEIVRRAVEQGMFKNLLCGTVIAIPVVNVFGFNNYSRAIGEGKDVNRNFPGSKAGSLASRVANTIARQVLPMSQLVIDFHTGGASRYNYPQVRFTRDDAESLLLARQFGARFIIEKPVIRGSLRKVARDAHVPMVIYEAGESLRLDGFSVEKGLHGLSRVLSVHGMREEMGGGVKPHDCVHISKMHWIRASRPGIFTPSRQAGSVVGKGELIGTITDPFGTRAFPVTASKSGYILSHNNAPIVGQGDALFNIAHAYADIGPLTARR